MDLKALIAPEKIFYNATIVTMSAGFEVFKNGYVHVKGDTIIAIGEHYQPTEIASVNLDGAIVIPGFVNTHTHLAMTMFRGLADDLPLKIWLEDYIWPAEAKFSVAENMAAATRLGLAELITTGTTTFADMYFFADIVATETAKAGLRGVMNESLVDFATNSYKTTNEAFALIEAFIAKWHGSLHIIPSLNLHSVYTCSEHLLKRALALLEKYPMPVQIHLSETRHEVEEVTQKHKKSPIAYFNNLGFGAHRVVAAHCVWPLESDYGLMQNPLFSVAHCPTSNLKLASGIAPVAAMMAQGIKVALGTDGCASNNNLDLVEEMRLAALIHKGQGLNPTLVNSREALAMATINGAKALGLDHMIGSLEVGKKADFLVIDRQNTFMTPIYDYYAAIVFAMNSGCISSVFVGGKPLMVNRKLITLNLSEVINGVVPVR